MNCFFFCRKIINTMVPKLLTLYKPITKDRWIGNWEGDLSYHICT